MLGEQHIGLQCMHEMDFAGPRASCSTCSAIWQLGPYGWHPIKPGNNVVKGHVRLSMFWRAIKMGVPVKKKKTEEDEDEFYDD